MLNKTNNSSKVNPFKELCEVYILYFDEARGHIPLLIYPSEKLINNKKFMRPIKYHSIWFLSVEEQDALDHIDLEYKGYTFMGKKFLTKSKRKKRRAGLDEETPETIVIIVCLPTDMDIFGDELIQQLTAGIREKFEDKFYEIIAAMIAKDEIIKTPKTKKIYENGKKIKEELRSLIAKIGDNYLSKVIRQADGSSMKRQKAISYLYLKGIDFSHISPDESIESFSNITLFEPQKKLQDSFVIKTPFNVKEINIIEDSNELEIIVKKNIDKKYDNLHVTISHLKDFFEKELLNQPIDFWHKDEDLLFISPIIPHINEYYLILINNKEKLLTKKIDINLLK